jgi:membrane-bound metal-dependent hydrolase YbcI (DUF457 family)
VEQEEEENIKSWTHSSFGLIFIGILYPILGFKIDYWVAGAAILGALLPDIDAPGSAIGSLLFPISYSLDKLGLKHRTSTHSLFAFPIVFFFLVALPTHFYPAYFQAFLAIAIGYMSHYLADALTKTGIPLLYPLREADFFVFPKNKEWRVKTGTESELWVFLSAGILAAILVPVAHPGPVALLKSTVTSPSNAVDFYHTLGDEYIVYAKVSGVWRDSQEKLDITAPVIGAVGSEDLLIYYEGDVYEVGHRPEAGIYPFKIDVIKDMEANITSRTFYFERVPFDHILVSIKRKITPGNLVIVTGRVKTLTDEDTRLMIMGINKRTEAYFAILPTEDSLVIFFSPLEKLEYLRGMGLYVHSARLTVREIPLGG